jgi:hypothetical protein
LESHPNSLTQQLTDKLFGSFSFSLEEFLHQVFKYPAEVLEERTP